MKKCFESGLFTIEGVEFVLELARVDQDIQAQHLDIIDLVDIRHKPCCATFQMDKRT